MICPPLPRADAPGSMAPTARQIQSLRDLGVDAEIFDMQGIPKLKYVQAIPRIRQLAASADLIHAHFGYCGWLARTASRKPMVISFMGDDLLGTAMSNGNMSRLSMAMARCNRRLARRANAVIVKSGEMARVLAPWPSTVIPNGVDLDVFRPMDRTAARTALGMDDGRHKVLFPGNPDYPVKGFPLASAAVSVAEDVLHQPIDLVPLWNVDPSRVPLYMNAVDAMLMTSISEGSPNVVKEAMACNTPVIGVPAGDVHELLDGVAGCVKSGRGPAEMGRHLAQMLVQPQPVAGRPAIVAKRLDLESIARRVIEVYESVLGGKPATRVEG
ncbi:glycosyltransferase [Candidatus Entotheonella palauensis]|nr:glycosyltransferase [Candidatus Entotheonella palauensis]